MHGCHIWIMERDADLDTVKNKGRIRQMKYCINKEIYIPVMVCVDAYEYRTLSGRLYPAGNGIEQEKMQIFQSSTQLLLEMKDLFEGGYIHQENSQTCESLSVQKEKWFQFRKGKFVTFTVRVMADEHASWQGYVTWHNGKNEIQPFKSVFELLHL